MNLPAAAAASANSYAVLLATAAVPPNLNISATTLP